MAQSRLEILTDEEAQSQAERDRFEELADQYRQQSHLPPGGDQSWREREAMRRAAYDKGYTPPSGDSSWREREAAALASTHEPVQEPAQEILREEATAEGMPEERYASREPVHVAKGGQGGTILIFILVAGIALGIAALAYPQMLTAAYWRHAQTGSVPQGPLRAAEPPATPAAPSAEQTPPAPAPALNAAPAPSADAAPPPAPPAPDAKAAPTPATPAKEASPPPAMKPALAPNANANPVAAPKPKPRAAARDDRSTNGIADRDAGGFYAKVPGPNGTMEYQYFPADPKMDRRMPAPKEPAVPDMGGFYAKAPAPDGTMQYRYFPSKPPPR